MAPLPAGATGHRREACGIHTEQEGRLQTRTREVLRRTIAVERGFAAPSVEQQLYIQTPLASAALPIRAHLLYVTVMVLCWTKLTWALVEIIQIKRASIRFMEHVEDGGGGGGVVCLSEKS